MLTIWQIIILGAVQGLTEFIPVSSSGHLEIVPKLLGWNQLSTDLMLFAHLGTLLALLIFFRLDLWQLAKSLLKAVTSRVRRGKIEIDKQDRKNIRLIWLIILGAIPAAVLGILLDSRIESFYDAQTSSNERVVTAVTLSAMAVVGILFIMSFHSNRKKRIDLDRFPVIRAIVVGFSQVLAFVRGVSRSGITMLSAQALGLSRVGAARYSFLLSIPLLLGTSAVSILDLTKLSTADLNAILPQAIAITLSSFIFGFLAIRYLLNYLQKNSLAAFGWYRIVFAVIAALLLFS